jgi:hypothetical protein
MELSFWMGKMYDTSITKKKISPFIEDIPLTPEERRLIWNIQDKPQLLRTVFVLLFKYSFEKSKQLAEEFPKMKEDYKPIRIEDDKKHEAWMRTFYKSCSICNKVCANIRINNNYVCKTCYKKILKEQVKSLPKELTDIQDKPDIVHTGERIQQEPIKESTE